MLLLEDPLAFYHQRGVFRAKEWAFMLIQWNRAGFRMSDRCVVLPGSVVRPASKGKFWEYDPVNKNLIPSYDQSSIAKVYCEN